MKASMPSAVLPSDTTSSELRTGTAHGRFVDAVMRQHIGLAFRGSRAVAAHGGKDEWPRALRFPIVHRRSHDGGDIGDAAAAYSERYPRAGLEARAESGFLELDAELRRGHRECGDLENAAGRGACRGK